MSYSNKEMQLAWKRKWRSENLEKARRMEREARLRRRKKNPSLYHDRRLREKYGMSPGMWKELFCEQGGLCKICRSGINKSEIGRNADVDHNHATGQVRGLLCPRCNILVGQLERNDALIGIALRYIRTNGWKEQTA